MEKPSDRIANDPICIRIARKADPSNYLDTFNACWLRIKETEIRNPDLIIKDHRKYFKTAVRRYIISGKKEIKEQPEYVPSSFKYCVAELIEWCEYRSGDEFEDFYREIMELRVRCRSVEEAIEMTGMHRTMFFRHYNEAKKRLKNDLLRNSTEPDSVYDSMV